MRGGTLFRRPEATSKNISIHPPLAGRDDRLLELSLARYISIHPPLAGRDTDIPIMQTSSIDFNPPAPCGAGLFLASQTFDIDKFQSTRPLRGGTIYTICYNVKEVFQSTRPLRGGTMIVDKNPAIIEFQSTRPLRGGTAILHKKTVQNIAYCTKSAFTLAVLSGFLALMRPFFLPNVHKFRCEPSEESLLAPRSHAYTIRTPSG